MRQATSARRRGAKAGPAAALSSPAAQGESARLLRPLNHERLDLDLPFERCDLRLHLYIVTSSRPYRASVSAWACRAREAARQKARARARGRLFPPQQTTRKNKRTAAFSACRCPTVSLALARSPARAALRSSISCGAEDWPYRVCGDGVRAAVGEAREGAWAWLSARRARGGGGRPPMRRARLRRALARPDRGDLLFGERRHHLPVHPQLNLRQAGGRRAAGVSWAPMPAGGRKRCRARPAGRDLLRPGPGAAPPGPSRAQTRGPSAARRPARGAGPLAAPRGGSGGIGPRVMGDARTRENAALLGSWGGGRRARARSAHPGGPF